MRLTLDELQRAVKRAVDAEKAVEQLRNEIKRVLGPAVITEGPIDRVAAAANDRLDVMERTGQVPRSSIKPAALTRVVNHNSAEVRRLAARALPEQLALRLATDKDASVRAAVARRAPMGVVREMLKEFPVDDLLRSIYKQRRLAEAGLHQPKIQDKPFDLHGEERLGASAKQPNNPELSEQWYRDRALNFVQDYGREIEQSWEETLARRYCASVKATSGVEIDENKLLKAIRDVIEEREDRAVERNALKETLAWLRSQEDSDVLLEAHLPQLDENSDPVENLVESGLASEEFIKRAGEVFSVRESTLPPAIKKHRLGEQSSRTEAVPAIAKLPHSSGFRRIDERALDMYCKYWSDRQQLRGEPLKLDWSIHPGEVGKVSFSVTLR